MPGKKQKASNSILRWKRCHSFFPLGFLLVVWRCNAQIVFVATMRRKCCVCSHVTLKYVQQQILVGIGVLFTSHVCLPVSQCVFLKIVEWPL